MRNLLILLALLASSGCSFTTVYTEVHIAVESVNLPPPPVPLGETVWSSPVIIPALKGYSDSDH